VTRTRGRAACGVLALLAILPAGAIDAAEKWGPFRGQFIDVETGQPIAGAVVLVAWYEAVFALVQTNQRFYDAREAVTGADGRFEVPRLSPPFFSFRILDPDISYFAPGYIVEAEVVTPQDAQPLVAPTVVQMRRARTREELLRKSRGYLTSIPREKMPEFLKAINMEREMLGLAPERGKQP
jgi:hypothetical protein